MKHLVVTAAMLLHYTMADSTDLPISKASNAFASELYRELAKTPGNVLVCPVSVHIALALVHQGAVGTTRTELAKVLHLADSNIDVRNSYKALLNGLHDNEIKIATKLYPAISFHPKADYVDVARQYFLSDVEPLDYGKNVDAANIINKFVENKTNNKIHDIIKPDSLSDLTRLVIVNAVHFKAEWAKTFPPAFTDVFKVTPTQSIPIEFLGQTDFFFYKEDRDLGAKILKLDYKSGSYSMVFVLPNKVDGLPELEERLATKSIDNLLMGLKNVRVEVTIPKFKIEQEMQMKDILVKMGITHMFDSRADLSNVAGEENLYVDSIIQKTFIDVNEKGTEAAAATGVITPLSGGTEENIFIAQWPFHFYLIKNNTPVILFNGRLVKPKEKAKTPPKMSNQNPIIFNEEETFSNSNEGSNSDKFGIEGDTGSYNQESGINPSSNNGQNVNVNLPQNGYLKPLTPQSNNGQTKQPSIEDGSNINRNDFPSNNDQHSLPAPVHKQPFQQAGQQYSWQFGRPTPRPPFAPSRFGQTTQVVYQRPIGYPRPSNYPHQYEHDY